LRITLNIVGSGNDERRLKDIAHSLGNDELVKFRGAISEGELQGLLAEADVFVLPSKKEGFGIVYIEAMAAGLPCIGANHGGVPEVIEHGGSGFLIEYGDVAQLLFYLESLAKSEALYRVMSQAARKRASEEFALGNMTRLWLNLIDDLEANKVCAGSPA
jgi:glycosyltransferase involved in cell wall biosynthesis